MGEAAGGDRESGAGRELGLFIDFLSFERGLADATVKAYLSDVERLVDWLDQQQVRSVDDVDHRRLREYIYELKDRGLAPATIRRSISSIRSYFAFLLEEGRLESDPTELLETPSPGRTLPRVLTAAQIEALLEAPDESATSYWRDRAVLELLYATGMRVSELTGLTRTDIDLEEQMLRVRGKGSRERLIPFGSAAALALERYLRELRPRLDRGRGGGHVFLNQRGGPLTRMSVWTTVKENAGRAGIEQKVSPHTLRHTCATHLLEGGADLAVVQELLGHADISTTQIYTHLDRDHLRSVHRTSHPRA